MSGAELCARYSHPPNSYGYCGRSTFASAFCHKDPHLLEQELKKFHTLYAYLSLIARENGLKPFDIQVIRAFWIGNSLLENVSYHSLQSFLENELFPNHDPRARELSENLPKGLVPHHNFNPLYVHFVTDSVEKKIKNYDLCCITSGEVLSVEGRTATINRNCISEGPSIRQRKEMISIELIPEGLEPGDIVSVHWATAIEKLTPQDLSSLQKYTKINLDALARSGHLQ
jgi:hypothetical protein